MTDFSALAFIDELSASPERTRRWASAFSATDPVMLIVVPGSWSAERVATEAPALFGAAGIGDDESSARVRVLTGPLLDADFARLACSCSAIYGDAEVPPVLASLPRLDVDTVRLRISEGTDVPRPSLTPVAPVHQEFVVAPGIQLRYRDTEADRGVVQQVLVDQQYSVDWLIKTGWPDIARAATRSGSGGVPLIVDCGANIGASALYFRLVFPESQVVAIEPEQENFELLRHNTALLSGVTVLQNAIASEPRLVQITDSGDGSWAFRAGVDAVAGVVLGEVQAITIDDVLLAVAPDAVPFMLKVDIEGAEGDLFANRHDTLARFPVVVIELHDWMLTDSETSRSFLRWHVLQNRDIYTVGENIFSLSPALRRRAV
jgi:FkbM family methyltransferase